jgi:hypothetical protein
LSWWDSALNIRKFCMYDCQSLLSFMSLMRSSLSSASIWSFWAFSKSSVWTGG